MIYLFYRRFVWHGVEARLHLRKPKHCLLQSLVERGIKHVQVLSLKRGIRDIIIGMPEMTCLNLSGCYNVIVYIFDNVYMLLPI